MDATASACFTDLPELESSGFEVLDCTREKSAYSRRPRKISAGPAATAILVTSHLTRDEAVRQDEINLVLAFLRDTIADIMRDEK
jgi:hypothetical protein